MGCDYYMRFWLDVLYAWLWLCQGNAAGKRAAENKVTD